MYLSGVQLTAKGSTFADNQGGGIVARNDVPERVPLRPGRRRSARPPLLVTTPHFAALFPRLVGCGWAVRLVDLLRQVVRLRPVRAAPTDSGAGRPAAGPWRGQLAPAAGGRGRPVPLPAPLPLRPAERHRRPAASTEATILDGKTLTCSAPSQIGGTLYYLWVSTDAWSSPSATKVAFATTALPIYIYPVAALAGLALILAAVAACWCCRGYRDRRRLKRELVSLSRLKASSLDLDGLEFIKPLGAGASGEVFLGKLHGSRVAVKRLFSEEGGTDLAEFRAEVAILKSLRHPHVVLFMTATETLPRLIVCEFLPGGSLWDLLHTTKPLAWRVRWKMALDAALGMQYRPHAPSLARPVPRTPLCARPSPVPRPSSTLAFHSCVPPIIHNDLKSANLLLDMHADEYIVKVADFGVARLGNQHPTTSGGTLAWAAPEVIMEERPTLMSDVWSFGVCVWELATRKKPYDGIHPQQLIFELIQGSRRLEIPERVPECFRELMRRCFEMDPHARPSFAEIVRFIEGSFDQIVTFEKAERYEARVGAFMEEATLMRPNPIAGGSLRGSVPRGWTAEAGTQLRPLSSEPLRSAPKSQPWSLEALRARMEAEAKQREESLLRDPEIARRRHARRDTQTRLTARSLTVEGAGFRAPPTRTPLPPDNVDGEIPPLHSGILSDPADIMHILQEEREQRRAREAQLLQQIEALQKAKQQSASFDRAAAMGQTTSDLQLRLAEALALNQRLLTRTTKLEGEVARRESYQMKLRASEEKRRLMQRELHRLGLLHSGLLPSHALIANLASPLRSLAGPESNLRERVQAAEMQRARRDSDRLLRDMTHAQNATDERLHASQIMFWIAAKRARYFYQRLAASSLQKRIIDAKTQRPQRSVAAAPERIPAPLRPRSFSASATPGGSCLPPRQGRPDECRFIRALRDGRLVCQLSLTRDFRLVAFAWSPGPPPSPTSPRSPLLASPPLVAPRSPPGSEAAAGLPLTSFLLLSAGGSPPPAAASPGLPRKGHSPFLPLSLSAPSLRVPLTVRTPSLVAIPGGGPLDRLLALVRTLHSNRIRHVALRARAHPRLACATAGCSVGPAVVAGGEAFWAAESHPGELVGRPFLLRAFGKEIAWARQLAMLLDRVPPHEDLLPYFGCLVGALPPPPSEGPIPTPPTPGSGGSPGGPGAAQGYHSPDLPALAPDPAFPPPGATELPPLVPLSAILGGHDGAAAPPGDGLDRLEPGGGPGWDDLPSAPCRCLVFSDPVQAGCRSLAALLPALRRVTAEDLKRCPALRAQGALRIPVARRPGVVPAAPAAPAPMTPIPIGGPPPAAATASPKKELSPAFLQPPPPMDAEFPSPVSSPMPPSTALPHHPPTPPPVPRSPALSPAAPHLPPVLPPIHPATAPRGPSPPLVESAEVPPADGGGSPLSTPPGSPPPAHPAEAELSPVSSKASTPTSGGPHTPSSSSYRRRTSPPLIVPSLLPLGPAGRPSPTPFEAPPQRPTPVGSVASSVTPGLWAPTAVVPSPFGLMATPFALVAPSPEAGPHAGPRPTSAFILPAAAAAAPAIEQQQQPPPTAPLMPPTVSRPPVTPPSWPAAYRMTTFARHRQAGSSEELLIAPPPCATPRPRVLPAPATMPTAPNPLALVFDASPAPAGDLVTPPTPEIGGHPAAMGEGHHQARVVPAAQPHHHHHHQPRPPHWQPPGHHMGTELPAPSPLPPEQASAPPAPNPTPGWQPYTQGDQHHKHLYGPPSGPVLAGLAAGSPSPPKRRPPHRGGRIGGSAAATPLPWYSPARRRASDAAIVRPHQHGAAAASSGIAEAVAAAPPPASSPFLGKQRHPAQPEGPAHAHQGAQPFLMPPAWHVPGAVPAAAQLPPAATGVGEDDADERLPPPSPPGLADHSRSGSVTPTSTLPTSSSGTGTSGGSATTSTTATTGLGSIASGGSSEVSSLSSGLSRQSSRPSLGSSRSRSHPSRPTPDPAPEQRRRPHSLTHPRKGHRTGSPAVHLVLHSLRPQTAQSLRPAGRHHHRHHHQSHRQPEGDGDGAAAGTHPESAAPSPAMSDPTAQHQPSQPSRVRVPHPTQFAFTGPPPAATPRPCEDLPPAFRQQPPAPSAAQEAAAVPPPQFHLEPPDGEEDFPEDIQAMAAAEGLPDFIRIIQATVPPTLRSIELPLPPDAPFPGPPPMEAPSPPPDLPQSSDDPHRPAEGQQASRPTGGGDAPAAPTVPSVPRSPSPTAPAAAQGSALTSPLAARPLPDGGPSPSGRVTSTAGFRPLGGAAPVRNPANPYVPRHHSPLRPPGGAPNHLGAPYRQSPLHQHATAVLSPPGRSSSASTSAGTTPSSSDSPASSLPLPLPLFFSIMAHVGRALAHLHRQGVVYGGACLLDDVVLTPAGTAVLAGLQHLLPRDGRLPDLDEDGTATGSPRLGGADSVGPGGTPIGLGGALAAREMLGLLAAVCGPPGGVLPPEVIPFLAALGQWQPSTRPRETVAPAWLEASERWHPHALQTLMAELDRLWFRPPTGPSRPMEPLDLARIDVYRMGMLAYDLLGVQLPPHLVSPPFNHAWKSNCNVATGEGLPEGAIPEELRVLLRKMVDPIAQQRPSCEEALAELEEMGATIDQEPLIMATLFSGLVTDRQEEDPP
ncbi:putative mitogen-activated protein kinase kinase kinase YODA [Paratrimastix pyriformis]|uniref:Mitogen-activated protein kinase kinase kinase YODA n=1 Tax=Paratrimastix pyriformis TaxID=342808 RepID=A0ABQ8UVE4_9EUKA|nr:putative mitogen-activated protein kinase kinase kinase YODA [Paratrimastix pyriformis]